MAEQNIISCPGCGKKYDVSKYPGGTTFQCPACKGKVTTPQDESAVAAAGGEGGQPGDDAEMTLAGPDHDALLKTTQDGGEQPAPDRKPPDPDDLNDAVTLFPGTLVEQPEPGEQPAGGEFPGEKTMDSDAELADRSDGTGSRFTALEGFRKTKGERDAEASGKKFGEFNVVRELGRGAMGVVYEAIQKGLNRRVALKVMLSSFTGSEEALERFIREGQATARLKHPNIVPVFGLGEEDGDFYYAMDYIEGKSLKTALKDDVTTFKERAAIVRDAARGLDYAHNEGVVHRDIKPANIMLNKKGHVLIADFGIAKTEESSTLTAEGQILGTPMYMSPEQADGLPGIDGRADVYSLGATLYEAITGARPFHGEDVRSIIRNVLEVEPVPPRKIDPKIPKDLETICLKSIEKHPDKRYQTAGDFADDLERFLNGEAIHAKPLGMAGKLFKKMKRNKAATALLFLLFLVLAGGAAFAGWRYMAWKQDVDARLAAANKAFEEEDFAGAKEKYLGVLAIAESNAAAEQGVGRCEDKLETLEKERKERQQREAREKLRKEALSVAERLTADGRGHLAKGKAALRQANVDLAQGKASAAEENLSRAFARTEKAVDDFAKALGKVPDHVDAEEGKVEAYLLKCRVEVQRMDFGKAMGYILIARDTSKGRFFEKDIDELARLVAGTGRLAVGTGGVEGRPPRLPAGCSVALAAIHPDTYQESEEREDLGETPLQGEDIAMGNYVLYVAKEGFETVRYPLYVDRNAELAVDFAMLKKGAVPEGMVYVPAGDFLTGDSYSGFKTAYLEGYFIDRTEVTHEAYKKFFDTFENRDDKLKYVPKKREGVRIKTLYFTDKGFAPYKGKNLPAYGVTWENARDFAAWAGRRLPTVKEWEKAARGADGRLWPWGDRFAKTDLCNFYGRRKNINIEAVTSYPGSASPYGCLNMAGNVAEFTATEGDTIEVGGRFIKQYFLVGGSAADNKFMVMTTATAFVKPDMFGMGVGFRCVKDLK